MMLTIFVGTPQLPFTFLIRKRKRRDHQMRDPSSLVREGSLCPFPPSPILVPSQQGQTPHLSGGGNESRLNNTIWPRDPGSWASEYNRTLCPAPNHVLSLGTY